MQAREVIRLLTGKRLLISNEKAVQRQLDEIFKEAGLALDREVQVKGGFLDFRERPRGLAIEVKITGSARGFHRQMAGYAADPSIDEFLLITTRACGMPETIGGKPVSVFGLGSAHL